MSAEIKWISQGFMTLSETAPIEMVHYTLMCMMMREDYPEVHGRVTFSRRHPLACYVGSMLLCFAGVILGNMFIGEPLLSSSTPFMTNGSVFRASLVWYLIHYMPYDLVYKFCSLLPVKLLIVILKEIHRSGAVVAGFQYASVLFPDSCFIISIYAILRATGSMQMRIIQRLVCGVWSPVSIEFLKPSLTSKMSACAVSMLLIHSTGFVPLSIELFHLFIALAFICVKLAFFLKRIDCFAMPEQFLCYAFLGGLADKLETMIQLRADPEGEEQAALRQQSQRQQRHSKSN